MQLTNESRITRSPDVVFQEVSGETVLLDLGSEVYFGLDEVGTRIWALLEDSTELGSIIRTMLAEYDVSESKLRSDLEGLFSSLIDEGLITIEPST